MLAITRVFAVAVLAIVAASCGSDRGVSPLAPAQPSAVFLPPVPLADPKGLVVFREPSGFSTTDLYDAHDRIVQLTNGGDLVLTADGARFPGYHFSSDTAYWGSPTYFISLPSGKCEDFCVFSVRFGTEGGQRRAYVTIDYGHSNPGTLVDVVAAGGKLVVTQTSRFPPGTPTLSGVVTEATSTGLVPVVDAWACRGIPAGWQCGQTDESGRYSIGGLIEGTEQFDVFKDGYQKDSRQVALNGDARIDVQLVRR